VTPNDAVSIAFNHMLDKLRSQHEYVIALRNQAGLSAAVSGLIAGAFSTLSAENGVSFSGDFFLGFSVWGLLVVTSLSASIAFSALVAIHYSNFTFSFDTEKMLARISDSVSADLFLEGYIRDGEWYFRDNEKLIEVAQQKLWFAMLFGFSQIIPWLMLLRSSK
jgi:hypothetical protein